MLDAYCDKCVELIEENNRKHLERLKDQRDHKRMQYETEMSELNIRIKELEDKLST